jgi:uncharacterized membrane protein required for colicin V production
LLSFNHVSLEEEMNMSTAQLFDTAAALFLVVLGLVGLLRGFISAVMSFVGLFCGTYFAWKLSEEGTAVFLGFFPDVDKSIASLVAMVIIFLCVALMISLISRLLGYIISYARLSGVNRLAGMFIGLAAGFFLIVAAYGAITLLAPEAGRGWIEISIFMSFAEVIWPYVYDFLVSRGFLDSAKLIPPTV